MAYKIKGKFAKARRAVKRKKWGAAARAAGYKRARVAVRARTKVVAGVGFPKQMTMTHKYAEVVSITSTAGVVNSYIFKCNGMYDPNHTGTGHQPMYFDQMAALYDHYVVIGAKIDVKLVPATASTTAAACAIFINDDTTAAATDLSGVVEQTQASKIKILPAGTNNVTYLSRKWSAKKFFGGSIMANTELQGSATSDPTELSNFQICYQDLSVANSTVRVYVEITYIAVWKELKDIAQS